MSNNPNKINLDQLLELKRSEKPPAEFWDGFQKDFRQRQLQTLISEEPSWKRLLSLVCSKTSLLFPLSGMAVAVFVLVINFQKDSPLHSEYYNVALSSETSEESAVQQLEKEEHGSESVAVTQPAEQPFPTATASFVMDLIPHEEPASLAYTRQFPTATIPAERRSTVASLVSFSMARDSQNFGMMARPQTAGF